MFNHSLINSKFHIQSMWVKYLSNIFIQAKIHVKIKIIIKMAVIGQAIAVNTIIHTATLKWCMIKDPKIDDKIKNIDTFNNDAILHDFLINCDLYTHGMESYSQSGSGVNTNINTDIKYITPYTK